MSHVTRLRLWVAAASAAGLFAAAGLLTVSAAPPVGVPLAGSAPKSDAPPAKKPKTPTTPAAKTPKPTPKEPDEAEPRPEPKKKPRKTDDDPDRGDKPTKPIVKVTVPKTGTAPDEAEDPLAKEPDAEEEGFKLLFDGKTLGRWQGDKKLWSVKNGAITGRHDGLKGASSSLIYPLKFDDFVLKVQYKLVDDRGACAVQFRCRQLQEKALLDRGHTFVVAGPQAKIADAKAGTTGSCYDERGRGSLSHPNPKQPSRYGAPEGAWEKLREALRPDEFNEYVITCRGKHVVIELNGVTVADFTDEAGISEGQIALQLAVGLSMEVQFKDIRIKRLPKE